MIDFKNKMKHFISKFIKDCRGVAALEGMLLLPVLLSIMIGCYDIGQAIIINQKVTSAAHTVGDLLAREMSVTNADLNDAYVAAQLVIDPYDRGKLGVDIVGILFVNDTADPQEEWRRTYNMTQNTDLPAAADGLGVKGEGLIAVTTTYTYTPFFSSFVTGSFDMEETAFLRGRINSFVSLN